MKKQPLAIAKLRIPSEDMDYPWMYFLSDREASLESTFCHILDALVTYQRNLIDRSTMPSDLRAKLITMSRNLTEIIALRSLQGLEVEIAENYTRNEKPDGLTLKVRARRLTMRDAHQWLAARGMPMKFNKNCPSYMYMR